MQALNLPTYNVKIIEKDGKINIFDPIRKKYLVLTPEEWVRQHFVNYLCNHKNYPASLIQLENGLKYNFKTKRTDIVAYSSNMQPLLLIECKAPSVKISQNTFEQAATYSSQINPLKIILTNGLQHFCFSAGSHGLLFDDEIPYYEQIKNLV